MATRRITLDDVVALDYDAVADKLAGFVKRMVADASAEGVVLGVSGGVDSAAALALAVKALGPDQVLALIMPDSSVTPIEDVKHARMLVDRYEVAYKVIDIKQLVDSYLAATGEMPDKKSLGNLRARIRMSLLYLYANIENRLVMGTGDRSEILIGYFTKYGDGAADFHPIGCLYKSQVRMLAKHLGVPKTVAEKPSSPRLWPGQLAEEELGLPYEEIDLILYAVFDLGLGPEEAAEATGLERWKIQKVLEMHRATRHKREPPPVPPVEEYVKPFYRRVAGES